MCACSFIHVIGLVKDSLLCSAAADYDPDSASVFFIAGQGPGATQSFSFDIIDDNLVEFLESFFVQGDVSTAPFPSNFSNGQDTDTVTVDIADNDGRSLLISMHDLGGEKREGDSGVTQGDWGGGWFGYAGHKGLQLAVITVRQRVSLYPFSTMQPLMISCSVYHLALSMISFLRTMKSFVSPSPPTN